MSGVTQGYCRIVRWNARTGEADLRMGLPREDSPDDEFTFAAWTPFRCEADAREFVRRWNCHAELLAACEAALTGGSAARWEENRELIRKAIRKAKGESA